MSKGRELLSATTNTYAIGRHLKAVEDRAVEFHRGGNYAMPVVLLQKGDLLFSRSP